MISQDHVFGTSDASQPSQERRDFERFPDRTIQFLDAVFKKGRERKTYIGYLLPSRRRTIVSRSSSPRRRSIFRSSSKSYKRTSPPAGLSRSILSIRWLPPRAAEAPSSNLILCVQESVRSLARRDSSTSITSFRAMLFAFPRFVEVIRYLRARPVVFFCHEIKTLLLLLLVRCRSSRAFSL